ncbi:MAG: hypothetical protein B7Y78_14325 [Caulobacter sp. 35-67-4]|jgi:uncharacterized membrane protein YkoI|nr:MAG: hypothetical protein B7Y78_14325 [Caulobacter sp. 35-67-4]
MTQPLIRTRLALLLLPLALALAAGGAQASDKKHNHEVARAALARGDVLPLTKILAIAAQRAPGEVIDVELEEDKGRMKYDLKILTKGGRVLELELDAKSGATLKLEED